MMSCKVYDTLILSDLHLGSELSRARDARHMLEQNCFRRLILLGDIFSDLNFRRLNKEHWKFLGCIRKLSNPKRNIEVVWVEGSRMHSDTAAKGTSVSERLMRSKGTLVPEGAEEVCCRWWPRKQDQPTS